MLTITLMLLVCQQLSTAWTTRLPLEVYELTPVGSAAATTTHDLHYLQHQQQQQQTHQQPYQQHKNLEYATVNAKQQQQQQNASLTTLATETARTTTTTTTSSTHVDDATDSHPLDRRRPKQMLEIQQQEQHHQFQQQHRFDHSAMQHHLHRSHQQQQQQQQKNSKDVRILYQVGDSEDDLPICAPNAVCSKIDLYETPWIERQCRCPDANRMPNVIIHHHNSNNNNNKESLDTNSYTHIPTDKFRNYYEKEKFLQHRRILVSADFADKRFESLHLRKLMQKLGAVYQDDLDLQPADFLETNEDGLRDLDVDTVEDEISENEFPPHVARRNPYKATKHSVVLLTPPTLSTAHMRHSGHGNRAKELSFIGGCPSGLGIDDGHTIADKTRHYKMCSPVHKLPVCKHFRDYTWTLTTSAELNVTEQIVHCRCPKNSVTYLTKREAAADGSGGFAYLFACSPLTRIRCQRKQPCKLFTVRKRQEFLDEVNINALCQCPKGHHCPGHHTQSGVIPGESFLEDNIQTYSGYCMAND